MAVSSPTGRGKYIRYLFSLGDLAIINLLFLAVTIFFPEIKSDSYSQRELWLLINLSCLPVYILVPYSPHELRAIRMDYVLRTSILSVCVHALFLISMMALMGITTVSGKALLSYYSLMFAALSVFRLTASVMLKQYRRRGYNFLRVVIIGSGPTASRLNEALTSDAGYGYKLLGVFDNNCDPSFSGGKVRSIDGLEDFIVDNRIDQIFFTLSGHNEVLSKVVRIANDHAADFYYVPQLPRTLSRSFEYHNIGSVPVLSIRRNPLKNVFNSCLKRTFDIMASSVFLVFFPLVYIPVAAGIKMSSPGPVFFRQLRTGYRGKPFTCIKFRTMRLNADCDSRPATENDPRKTRFGDFLRRMSLDELPQFINVWKGEMSIVGPRPHMLSQTELYSHLVERFMARHTIKPGITGWAQVNGLRGSTDELWKMEQRVEHDIWYIENWTFLLDLKIIARTVYNALAGDKNAY